jgi:predicted dehydrogenase
MSRDAPSPRRLNVAIAGCGQFADAHLQQIQKIPRATLVAVCDRYRDLAAQAAARFGVPQLFESLEEMLAQAKPDVVHITTPANTHFAVASECLRAGCHVYVEKPFTETAQEAEELVRLAARGGLKVCVGHDQLFDPSWLALRRAVDEGAIGPVRHVESVLGYPISGQFGTQVSADAGHWVRRLPGGLFHNTISHPLYRITEYLADEEPEITAGWACRPPFDFPTELQVFLRGKDVSGSLTFASTIAPQRISRVYGPKGGLEVDLDGRVVRFVGPSTARGAFGKLATPWRQWKEAGRNVRRNVNAFIRSDIHYFAGLQGLAESFYASIADGTESPVASREVVRVTRIMDRIFAAARRASEAGASSSAVVI